MPRVVVFRALRDGRYLCICSPDTRLEVLEDWCALAKLEAVGASVEWSGVTKPAGYDVTVLNLTMPSDPDG